MTLAALGLPGGAVAAEGRRVLLPGNGRLAVWEDGKETWEMPWEGIHDIHVLPNGHYVIGNCHAGPGQPLLVEIDPQTKKVVWQLDGFEWYGNSVPNSVPLDELGKSRR